MAKVLLDFVSQDHMAFSGEVNEIIAPGSEGVLGILPGHAPLMTVLAAGEVMVRIQGQEDLYFAVSGGWMEVRPNKVTILASAAERADEINLQRAEAARDRAEKLLTQGVPREERTGIEMALRRSEIRLKVAHKHSRSWSNRPGEGRSLDQE